MNNAEVVPLSFIKSFSRSQVSSAAATLVDWGLLFALVEIFGVWYVIATALGAAAGGITNFVINRHWSFEASHGLLKRQVWRYTLISGSSMALNTLGVWVMTEFTGFHYSISVIVISLAVGFFFNYPLHRYFVFK